MERPRVLRQQHVAPLKSRVAPVAKPGFGTCDDTQELVNLLQSGLPFYDFRSKRAHRNLRMPSTSEKANLRRSGPYGA